MRHRIRFIAGIGVAAVLLTIGWARAADQDDPRFEVASIRRAQTGNAIGIRTLPNGIDARLSTVRDLVMFAYELASYQVVGGPAWITSNRFELAARADGEVTPAVARQMLKTLLRDRFSLRAHTETREADVHALVLARDNGPLGPGLTRTSADCPALDQRKPVTPDEAKKIPVRRDCNWTSMGSDRAGGSIYTMNGVALDRLVTQITIQVAGPVVDRTGLGGLFDIRLNFASPQQQRLAAPSVNTPDLTRDVGLPPLHVALEEQLGLRLQTQKGPLEVLVIDSVERPSEN